MQAAPGSAARPGGLPSARLGPAWHGSDRLGSARREAGSRGQGRGRGHGSARLGLARSGSARLGLARRGADRSDRVGFSAARPGWVRPRWARLGVAGLSRHGARSGLAGRAGLAAGREGGAEGVRVDGVCV